MTDEQDYFKSEEFQEILNKYENAVRSRHPVYMDADDLANIADYYAYEGRQKESEEAIDLALQYNPNAIGPLLYKAREAMFQHDFETADSYANRIQPLDYLEYLYLRGEILINAGKEAEADELFRQYFLDIAPDEHTDYVYDVANLYSEYNLHDKAIEWIARSKGDDSDDFKELMARTLFGLGKYEDSERLFNELIDHNPYSKHYWIALASAQFMNEDYGASVTSSEYAIAIDPDDVESILAKANALYNLDNYEEALSYFERYTEKVDFDEFGYLYQGVCLVNLGRFEEAISRLELAEAAAPADSQYLPEIYQELAFAHCESQHLDTALAYIDKTRELNCDHIDMEVIRGHILTAGKRLEEAEAVFKNAIIQSGNAPKTMLRIIVSLYDNRYIQVAYTLLKRFLSIMDQERGEGYAYMALCCLDLHKYDEFMQYLNLAVEKNPKEARMVLGHFFPSDMKPSDYSSYIKEKMNIQ